jgi:uncharacterized protein YcaQ
MTTLDDLRRFAVVRSLFKPTTLERGIAALGFVQADPIRAPARAQDLTLRPRVDGYRAGDLDRRYPELPVEEDVFINYGFVTRRLTALMHPRTVASLRPTARNRRAEAVLAFVRARGAVHPRDVDAHFAHGRVTNYWGGSSNATTHLLEAMHYKGQLRVVRREGGVRVYAAHEHGPAPIGRAARDTRIDAIVDVAVRKYAPLPAASLSYVVGRLRYAVPQWRGELRRALERARGRLARARVDGTDWYWPADEQPSCDTPSDVVRLLGLGVSLRSVHARVAAYARVLRAAARVARSRRRVGKRIDDERGAPGGLRVRRYATARPRVQTRARRGGRPNAAVSPSCSACGRSSANPLTATCSCVACPGRFFVIGWRPSGARSTRSDRGRRGGTAPLRVGSGRRASS